MEFEGKYWFEDCPMLKSAVIKFLKSNKKYLFAYCDSTHEYRGEFYDELPPEDIFIKSYNRGDLCGAIFERDFAKEIDIDNNMSINESLFLIDEDVYELERNKN